ncbi:hypothetical protein ARMSODRAFT_1018984 [Armillaria solidipes]|uniref:Uncharacterized protein n=1 Tax=Armillaria solidipes TaxID=1076256 RepID=A0A2H3BRK2_9AGAR|nr:hypothetical protein ARMSODRAFT_1018984 [Armillaria solidipes]
MRDALDGLRDMEASVFHSTNYLITQITTCTPFQEEATLAILKPLRDAVVDFLNPVVEAWSHVAPVVSYLASLPAPPSSWIAGKYYSMRLNAQSARNRLSNLDAVVASVEAPLLDQLRGPWGLEQLLRVLKWLGTSSTRVDILDSLHQLLLEFHTYCVRTMRNLDVIEQFVVGLHDFFSDEDRVRALNSREEVCRRLHDLSRFATKSMQDAPSHLYMLGLKGSEVSVRSDYKGRGHLREDSTFSRIIP